MSGIYSAGFSVLQKAQTCKKEISKQLLNKKKYHRSNLSGLSIPLNMTDCKVIAALNRCPWVSKVEFSILNSNPKLGFCQDVAICMSRNIEFGNLF